MCIRDRLYLIFPTLSLIGLGIFFFASVLIDVDHYIFFVLRKKSWNLRKAYKHFRDLGKYLRKLPIKERQKYHTGIYIFHGFEPMAFVILMGILFHKYLFFVAGGMFF